MGRQKPVGAITCGADCGRGNGCFGCWENTMYRLLDSRMLPGISIGRLWQMTNTAMGKFCLDNSTIVSIQAFA